MGGCGDWLRAGLGAAQVRARVPSASAAFLALVLFLWLSGPEEAFTLTASSVLSHRQAKYHLPVSNTERFHSVPELHRAQGSSTAHLAAASDDCTTREGNSYNIEIDSQWTETSNQTLPALQPHTGSSHTNYLQAELYNPYDFAHLRQLDSNYHPSGFYHLNPHDVYAAAAHGLLTDEDLLHAGVIASLRESGMDQNRKVEIPKSSVSSLRLQQLKQMGFSTEKAVLALAASGKIESAINLLVEDQVGDDAVVTAAKVKTTST
ncbi:uncharacterized protein LOC132827105 isoform X3 [Hemiscyllium ocellatum]|uniref:uncharacterized protein LOC132827105 isoform X3 n=1 Tax=Hemiscyllium ocellatum TaxID=170820 RepID=UPI0029676888|nr:uncharacterized protein LOC132827105 isoform X3 [Hemiscyllium ocellatum]